MIGELKTFVPIARKVQDNRSKAPMIQYCCVENGYIRMTDAETTVLLPIPDNRSYTLPMDVLFQIMKSKPNSLEVEVLPESDQIQIKYDQGTVKCPKFDPEEYPDREAGDFQNLGKWTPETFQILKEQCQYVSSDEAKPALNGIWVAQGKTLESCASDGHMLQYYPVLQSKELLHFDTIFSGILPVKPIKILAKFAKEPVRVSWKKDAVKFGLSDGIEVMVRMIDERFPDFKPLLDFANRETFEISKSDLLGAVQSAKPFANKHTRKGIINIQDSNLRLTAEDPESQTAFETSVPIKNQTGKELLVGLNLLYLERLLKPFDAKIIQWHYRSGMSASLFTNPSQKGERAIGLLMPIRLENE